MSAYTRLKRYRQRKSLERERNYLAKDWSTLGTDTKHWSARHCASRKRWIIYYACRKRARESGIPMMRPAPRHWSGPAERAKKLAKARKPSVNLGLVRHLF